MEPNAFKLGVQAARSGDFQKASAYFSQVVQANPNSEKGWLYLGHCLSDRAKRITCYQRVIQINPYNTEAQKALTDLGQLYYTPQRVEHDAYSYPPATEYPVFDKPRQTPPTNQSKPKKNSIGSTLFTIAGSLVVCIGLVCLGLIVLSRLPRQDGSEAVAASTATTVPGIDPALLPAPAASRGTGRACLGFDGRGVACLDESGWQTYTSETAGLPDTFFSEGAFCPDGSLVIAHHDGFSLLKDQKWEHLPLISDEFGPAYKIACDQGNHLWATHLKGVSRYVDGAWQHFGIDLLIPGSSTTKTSMGVVAAPDGSIWVQTPHSVAWFANETWTIFHAGQGFASDLNFLTINLDSAGRPWVAYDNGIAVYDNGSWKQFANGGPTIPQEIGFDARGWFWMSTAMQGVTAFDGQSWKTYNKAAQQLSSDYNLSLATDARGRVWVGTAYGLSVFDGTQWQVYRMDNSDLMDHRISFVVLQNDGPTLAAPVEKAKGSVIGQFPMRYKRVELCIQFVSGTFSGETPCTGQETLSMTTRTDEYGNFIFENVPPGYYYLYAETNTDEWAKLTDDSNIGYRRILVTAGEQYNLGPLEFSH